MSVLHHIATSTTELVDTGQNGMAEEYALFLTILQDPTLSVIQQRPPI